MPLASVELLAHATMPRAEQYSEQSKRNQQLLLSAHSSLVNPLDPLSVLFRPSNPKLKTNSIMPSMSVPNHLPSPAAVALVSALIRRRWDNKGKSDTDNATGED